MNKFLLFLISLVFISCFKEPKKETVNDNYYEEPIVYEDEVVTETNSNIFTIPTEDMSNIDDLNESIKNSSVLKISGGYNVLKIEDQTLQNGSWITDKIEPLDSFLYFDNDMLWFKRGENMWIARKLALINYDSIKEVYVYDSIYGLTEVDKNNNYIIFYDKGIYNKRYIYMIGSPSESIKAVN